MELAEGSREKKSEADIVLRFKQADSCFMTHRYWNGKKTWRGK
jgi:hypothetical protein